jgi:hypothetical protein
LWPVHCQGAPFHWTCCAVVACGLTVDPIGVSRSVPDLRAGDLGCLSFLISLFVSPFLHFYLCVASVFLPCLLSVGSLGELKFAGESASWLHPCLSAKGDPHVYLHQISFRHRRRIATAWREPLTTDHRRACVGNTRLFVTRGGRGAPGTRARRARSVDGVFKEHAPAPGLGGGLIFRWQNPAPPLPAPCSLATYLRGSPSGKKCDLRTSQGETSARHRPWVAPPCDLRASPDHPTWWACPPRHQPRPGRRKNGPVRPLDAPTKTKILTNARLRRRLRLRLWHCLSLLLLRLLLLLCRTVATRGTWCLRCNPHSVPTPSWPAPGMPVTSNLMPSVFICPWFIRSTPMGRNELTDVLLGDNSPQRKGRGGD